MVKKYKVGDKLICLKDVLYGGSVIFTAGEYYTISHVGNYYYVLNGVSFEITYNYETGFDIHFGTLKQYRKLKLDKLKSYGRYKNIQSLL